MQWLQTSAKTDKNVIRNQKINQMIQNQLVSSKVIILYRSQWPFHSTQLRVASFGLKHLKHHGSLRLAAIFPSGNGARDAKLQVLHIR